MEDIPENQNTEPKTAVSVTIEDSEAEVTPAKQKKKRERPPPDPTDPAVIAAKAAEHTKGKLFFVLKDTFFKNIQKQDSYHTPPK